MQQRYGLLRKLHELSINVPSLWVKLLIAPFIFMGWVLSPKLAEQKSFMLEELVASLDPGMLDLPPAVTHALGQLEDVEHLRSIEIILVPHGGMQLAPIDGSPRLVNGDSFMISDLDELEDYRYDDVVIAFREEGVWHVGRGRVIPNPRTVVERSRTMRSHTSIYSDNICMTVIVEFETFVTPSPAHALVDALVLFNEDIIDTESMEQFSNIHPDAFETYGIVEKIDLTKVDHL